MKHPKSSHNMTGEYITLVENNFRENEVWYYFIRKENNLEEINFLSKQLESIEWQIDDNLCVFDLDHQNTVSAETAKQMSNLEINSYMYHRKFDGKLKQIDFGFRSKDKASKRMTKVFDLLSYGQIENFIDDEDIDTDDLLSESESESNSDSDSDSKSEKSSEDEKELVSALPKMLNISKDRKKLR
jgi:hypothetical protein